MLNNIVRGHNDQVESIQSLSRHLAECLHCCRNRRRGNAYGHEKHDTPRNGNGNGQGNGNGNGDGNGNGQGRGHDAPAD